MAQLKKFMAACVVLSSTAWAGEVNGRGGDTPIAGNIAGSICSYSGLQDGDPPFPSLQVQNYGAIVASLRGLPPFPGPGVTCNGHTGLFS
jgi:hypothetical protein